MILLPIHLKFSDPNVQPKSMDRALISSLNRNKEGLELLWIHVVLMAWVTVTWIGTLIWISKGAFRCRAQCIAASVERSRREMEPSTPDDQHNPHPHPQHPFHSMPLTEQDETNRGLRLRTVMVANIPSRLRSEKELKEYFEYHMSRPLAKPAIGLTSNRQPGLINKMVSYLINRVRKLEYFGHSESGSDTLSVTASTHTIDGQAETGTKPEVERVVLARKMTELASLLDRREEMLKKLETAHIKLARKTLNAVKDAMDLREYGPSRMSRAAHRLSSVASLRKQRDSGGGKRSTETDMERALGTDEDEVPTEDRMDMLIRTLGPFVEEFGMRHRVPWYKRLAASLHLGPPLPTSVPSSRYLEKQAMSPSSATDPICDAKQTVWDALFSLPRSTLDPYQPLIHLSALFRGKTVPSIDYYTAKVGFLTSLITENRSHPPVDFEPVSTAFVTFANPDDARRACKYLAVHPDNPLACMVEMAPEYEDLDWVRLMKQTFKGEVIYFYFYVDFDWPTLLICIIDHQGLGG